MKTKITKNITNKKCKHKWKKKEYIGFGVISTWEMCPKCNSERKRKVIGK